MTKYKLELEDGQSDDIVIDALKEVIKGILGSSYEMHHNYNETLMLVESVIVTVSYFLNSTELKNFLSSINKEYKGLK